MRLDAHIPLGIHLGLHVLHQLDWNQSLEPQFWPGSKSKQWNVMEIAWKTSSNIRIKHAISSHVQFVFPLHDAIEEENPTFSWRIWVRHFTTGSTVFPVVIWRARPGGASTWAKRPLRKKSMGNSWDFSADELGWQFQTFGNYGTKRYKIMEQKGGSTSKSLVEYRLRAIWGTHSMKVHKFGFWQIPPMRSLTSRTTTEESCSKSFQPVSF